MNEIPTVAQRMNGMGPAKGTGINKKSIKQNLFNKPRQQGQARSQQANSIPYRVPGQPAQPLTAPLGAPAPAGPAGTNMPLGSPQQGKAPSPLVNNDDPYFYNPIAKPDYSTIDPNDPEEIEYQRREKQRNDIWKRGGFATLEAYSTKERTRIGEEYKAKEAERLKKFLAARSADPEGFENWFYTIKSPGTLRPAGFTMRLPDPTNFVKPTRMPHLQEGWETPDPNQGPDSLRNLAAKANSYYANGQLGTDEANEAITKYATAVTADHTKRQNSGPDPIAEEKRYQEARKKQEAQRDNLPKEGPGSIKEAEAKFAALGGKPMMYIADMTKEQRAAQKEIDRLTKISWYDGSKASTAYNRDYIKPLTLEEQNEKHRARGGKFAMGLDGKMIPVFGEESESDELKAFKQRHKDAGGKFAPAYPGGPMIPVSSDSDPLSPSEKAINDKHTAGGGQFAPTPGGKMIPVSGTANNERSQSLIDAENAHRANGGQFAPDSQGRMIPVVTNQKSPMSAPVSSYNYV